MEGAAVVGARFGYRGLWRSKEGIGPTDAEATAVDITSRGNCSSGEDVYARLSQQALFYVAKKSERPSVEDLIRQEGPVRGGLLKTSVAGLERRQCKSCSCRMYRAPRSLEGLGRQASARDVK